MDMEDEDNITSQFLDEYEALCKKYNRVWSADVLLKVIQHGDIQQLHPTDTKLDGGAPEVAA